MKALIAAVCLAVFFSNAAGAADLHLEPRDIPRGQPALVQVCNSGKINGLRVELLDKSFTLWPGPDGCWHGALAVDLKASPRPVVLRVMAGERRIASAKLRVIDRDYGVRRITVEKKYTSLTPQQLARHREEIARQKKVYRRDTPRRLWRQGFLVPVPGKVVGPFGRRSLVNGQPRSPHGGVDLRAPRGAPVRAPARGKVALVEDTFFGGRVVLLDHGRGLVSGYRHFDQVLVRTGQMAQRGQVLGKAGSSGRVTGPHLHFDVHLGDAKVDPLAWIRTSRRLAERLGDD